MNEATTNAAATPCNSHKAHAARSSVRRLLSAAFQLAVAAAAAWWVFYIPQNPLAPFGAIPGNACFVHVSEDPGMRWAALKDLPLLPACFSSKDLRTIEQAAAYAGAFSAQHPSRLGRAVIAYAPPSIFMQQEAWFGAVWLGSWSHLARWWQAIFPPREYRPLSGCAARAAWRSRNPVNSRGHHLSFAFADGLLIFSLSRDPAAIRLALATHDKLLPSVASSPLLASTLKCEMVPDATERGWFVLERLRNNGAYQPTFQYAFTSAASSNINLKIRVEHLQPFANAPMRNAPELEETIRLAGPYPSLIAVMPVELLTMTSQSLPITAGSLALRTVLQSSALATSNTPVILTMSSAGSGAGFGKPPLRMPLPALLLAMRMGQKPERLEETMETALNLINTAYKTGLVLETESMPGADYFCQMHAPKIKFVVPPDNSDLPACAIVGDRMFLGTCGSHLASRINQSALCPALDRPEPSQPAMPPEPLAIWIWADLEQTGKAAEDALAIWRAMLIWHGADNETLRATAKIKAIVHALRNMGYASITLQASHSFYEGVVSIKK